MVQLSTVLSTFASTFASGAAMKLLHWSAAVFCTVTLLTGCDKLDHLQWSPDGKCLAVLSSDGLRVSDASGSLSKSIPMKLSIFRWLPDSKRALVVTTKQTTSWNEVKPLLSAAERTRTITVADSLWKFRGDPEKWKYRDDDNVLDSLVYLDYKYGTTAVKALLQKKSKKNVLPDTAPAATIYTLQLVNLQQDKAQLGPALLRTRRELGDVRISSNGKLAAVTEDNSHNGYQVDVVPIEGGTSKIISACASRCPDWSLDGKALFYISPGNSATENDPSTKKNDSGRLVLLASLMRLDVTDASGKVLAKFSKAQELAELPFSGSDRIRCLPDGSIILSSEQLKLPCTQKKFDQNKSLFKMSKDFQSLEPLPLSGDTLGNELGDFEINQDGTKAAVAGDHGEITVVDLATGQVTALEPKGTDLKFLPQWRSADELCFPVRNHTKTTGGHDVEVGLQTLPLGTAHILSKDWPAKSITFLVDTKESTTKKTTPKNRTHSPAVPQKR